MAISRKVGADAKKRLWSTNLNVARIFMKICREKWLNFIVLIK